MFMAREGKKSSRGVTLLKHFQEAAGALKIRLLFIHANYGLLHYTQAMSPWHYRLYSVSLGLRSSCVILQMKTRNLDNIYCHFVEILRGSCTTNVLQTVISY